MFASPAPFRRRSLLVMAVAAAGALAGLACSHSPPLNKLTVDEVAAKIAVNDGKTFLYDCNSKDHYAKEHLPGARWVDYESVTAADLPAEKGVMLVFYCASEL
ncbi:MAG: rhodanese-like domain-containing protein [Polyangiaceae bacterium]